MTVVTSLKAIDKNIALVATNANKLNSLIHTTALAIFDHAKEHGDCTRALALVKAMPASMRRTMLIQWFSDYSPITVKLASGKSPEAVGLNRGKNANDWNRPAAVATPFYDLAEQNPEDKEYDLAALIKMVQAISKRIGKKIDDGKVAANDIDKARELARKIDVIAA